MRGQGVDGRTRCRGKWRRFHSRCGRGQNARRRCGTPPMSSKSGKGDGGRNHKIATRLAHAGRNPSAHHGYVNTPVYHASTMLYPDAEAFVAHRSRYRYGRRGTPTSEALENALKDIEGPLCEAVALLPSGLAALLQANTRAVFVESPGSLTFEIQDIPAIAAVAHAHDAVVVMDNTWASPLHFRALEKGVDLSIQSGTKYIGGHSDLMLGTVAANKATWNRLKETVYEMGLCVGPDDMFLGMRGLRTMGVRLAQHQAAGIKVARWLEARPEVLRVLHPALESHPGHAIWKRDFTGACGLFSIVFEPAPTAAVHTFLDALTLFGIGASWGGFESLAVPFDCTPIRTARPWAPGGPTVRFHVGLEDVSDLLADLERGLAAFTASLAKAD